MGKINTIKDALVTWLEARRSTLGLKTIKADVPLQDIVENLAHEAAYFPAVIVIYTGRGIRREGQIRDSFPRFSLFVAARSASAPFASGRTIIDLCEALVDELDGQRLASVQKDALWFTGDEISHQDATTVIYQLAFETEFVAARGR